MATWTIRTDVFEGPLDLLLYLVRRDGVDLRTVSMARVADSYLAFLERMRELHLGVAGDYLVMASTLMYLKSLELLPRPPALLEDEEEDPREALIRRIAEYQRYKHAAEELDERPQLGRDAFSREPVDVERPLASPVDAHGLLDVYYELLTRETGPDPVHTLGDPGPDIEACCRHVLAVLRAAGGEAELGAVLSRLSSRVERLLSFLGVLEMARLRWLDLDQADHLGPVLLRLRADATLDVGVVSGRIYAETA